MAHLLIAGVPGTGKTNFSRWLRDTHEYVHIDVEKSWVNDPVIRFLLDRDVINVESVAENLKARSPNVVLDWGFVPALLGRVRQMIRKGFEPWWFTGDEDAARRAFLGRGTMTKDLFNIQMARIRDSWVRIEKVFDGRMLDVIHPAPGGYEHLPPEEVFRLMGHNR
ncbi:MAG: hypothetical protein WAV54_06400 [Acidimicrobiales bacterium]